MVFKVRESTYKLKRRKAIELFLGNPFGSATTQTRDRLLTLCMIVVLYVKLGVRPESIFGIAVSAGTPGDIGVVLIGLLVYFEYLYMVNVCGDMLLHTEKMSELSQGVLRGFHGLAVGAVLGFRILMDVLFPTGFVVYAIWLLVDTPT